MDFLARREHSRRELLTKLGRRFASDVAEQAVSRLCEQGLQSDQRFAASFVRQRSQRGYGPLRTRQELRQKGVADSDIETALEAEDIDWYAALVELVERKYRGEPPADIKDKAKRQRFLQSRGFSLDQIRELLR